MSKWVYLSDLTPSGHIMSLDNGEIRSVMSSAIIDRAPSGLRRHILEATECGSMFRETGEVMPITEDNLDWFEGFYRAPNSWNYDWPHLQVESEGDLDDDRRQMIVAKLSDEMSQYPYEFQIVGLQRRFLMYYSDGNWNSQQRFERLIPAPDTSPYTRSGDLRMRYNWIYSSADRDATHGEDYPHDRQRVFGGLRPCLYTGPAWVVRFLLNGVDVLLDRCRVYVDDNGDFICSDWCQRHDFSSYDGGINLQQGIYSFGTWVTGPCVVRNAEQGEFSLAQVKRTPIRKVLERMPVEVPQFEQAFSKAQETIAILSANTNSTAFALQPAVDAGPITADILAEAEAIAQAAWSAHEAAVASDAEPESITEEEESCVS